MYLTVSLRLRDKHRRDLDRQARSVNLVWNYCNETQIKAAKSLRPWLRYGELRQLTDGSSRLVDLNSGTVKRICTIYDDSRRARRRPWVRFRGEKALGWVPFDTQSVRFDGTFFWFRRRRYQTMHLRDHVPIGLVRTGSFNRDALGHWYINFQILIQTPAVREETSQVGIDLGLSTLAALSTGEKIPGIKSTYTGSSRLAAAQRKGNSRRTQRSHRRIRNIRNNYLHQLSARLTREHSTIAVGGASPRFLDKTNLAKSSRDSAWTRLRDMLAYKSLRNGARYISVNEAYTTKTCSGCQTRETSWPAGQGGLGRRSWKCSSCGAEHDRDVNAAVNILRIGLDTLARETEASGNLSSHTYPRTFLEKRVW